MGPVEALQFALSKEAEAIEMYQKFSAEHTAVKDIFWFLVGEEQKHKQLIEKKIHDLSS